MNNRRKALLLILGYSKKINAPIRSLREGEIYRKIAFSVASHRTALWDLARERPLLASQALSMENLIKLFVRLFP
jgi:hypothetical protein